MRFIRNDPWGCSSLLPKQGAFSLLLCSRMVLSRWNSWTSSASLRATLCKGIQFERGEASNPDLGELVMRRPDEQAQYEKKKHVALNNMGRREGTRSVVLKMQDGSFEQHMHLMTVRSSAARRKRRLARDAAKPSVWGTDYWCPRPSCHHRRRGKKPTDPKQCPKCGLRLAAKCVKQLELANLRMYPDGTAPTNSNGKANPC